jgi:hypothetical protein
MRRKREQSPAEGEFLFEIDPEPLDECVPACGGLPLFVGALRSLDVPGSVKRNLHVKQRRRGFDEPTYVESLLGRHYSRFRERPNWRQSTYLAAGPEKSGFRG